MAATMADVFPVILSGGSGTRLWPLSRRAKPKQFLALMGQESLLQETARRLKSSFFAPLTLIGNEAHVEEAEHQLAAVSASPRLHVLEPFGRNTAPAAAIAALAVEAESPGAVLALLPADHYIADPQAFQAAIVAAAADASAGRIVTFGIVPSAPETGYGYIRRAETPYPTGAYPVAEFVEKPDLPTALSYLKSGAYLWNSGMFLARSDVLLAELAAHAPKILEACRKAFDKGRRNGNRLAVERGAFESCPSDSIDYAVMEKTSRASVLPARMGWSDVGSWASLWELAPKDESGNVLTGDIYAHDSRNNYIRAESRLVATVGVEDLIIVETADSVLVARREKVQDIKAIIDRLAKDGRKER
jgi:mannose-1-phosphate guanylyltransferase/mannose-6-phosphate isomerase